MTVTRDATSGWYTPANAAEWTELLAGTGISNPSLLWLCQEAAGNLADSIGTFTGTSTATLYQQAIAGWSRKGITLADGLARTIVNADAGLPNINTNSMMLFGYVSFPASVGATMRSVFTLGPTFGSEAAVNLKASSSPTNIAAVVDPNTVNGAQSTTAVHPLLIQVNRTAVTAAVQTDLETLAPALTGTPTGKGITIGGDNAQTFFAGGTSHLYIACWFNAAAELDASHRATLLSVLQNGPLNVATAITLPVVGTDVPDHIAAAVGRLLEQDKGKTNITNLVTVYVTPIQALESALWQLLTQRRIANAIGSQLDALGKLVGIARNGLSDSDYRVFIYVQIAVNTSRGRHEDLVTIGKLAINNTAALIEVKNQPIAQVVVRIGLITVTDALGAYLETFLQAAASAGVRVVTQWSNNTPANTFTFDIGPGFDIGKLASTAG